jgi:HSP20 family protein
MTTRNETTDTRNQETRQQSTGSQQSSRNSGEKGSDRERQLQTTREGGAQTGMVRSEPSRERGSVSRHPFAQMSRMMEDMDRMFERLGMGRGLMTPAFGGLGRDFWSGTNDMASLWSPAVEMFEKGDKLVVRAELPGVSKDDVSLEITDDVLMIEGERRQESEDREEGFYRTERSYGRFLRSIPLPEGVDGEKADARFQDGVLEITLPAPKHERKRGRKLSIR